MWPYYTDVAILYWEWAILYGEWAILYGVGNLFPYMGATSSRTWWQPPSLGIHLPYHPGYTPVSTTPCMYPSLLTV